MSNPVYHLKHKELPPPPPNKPFEYCQLGRDQYAPILKSIVESSPDGFVMAINNEWGTGKTTFIKMWEQYLKDDGYQTIYFNAWENDFGDDPQIPILGELKRIVKDNNDEETFDKIITRGSKIATAAIPALLMGFLKARIDNNDLEKAIEAATQEGMSQFKKSIDEYEENKNNLILFKEELEKFIQSSTNDKPIIFIIDELDRCRPNYSVSVLEAIKHFFSVSGIVFVLSIDKTQLAHAVRGVYGSDKINAEEYLKRFIDIEYSIPKPEPKEFINYLFGYFRIGDFFIKKEWKSNITVETVKSFKNTLIFIVEHFNVNLRTLEKMISKLRVVLNMHDDPKSIFPSLTVFLLLIKNTNEEFYSKLTDKKFSTHTLAEELDKQFLITHVQLDNSIIKLKTLMIILYVNTLKNNSFKSHFTTSTSNWRPNFEIANKDKVGQFAKILCENGEVQSYNLNWLLKRIELLEPMK